MLCAFAFCYFWNGGASAISNVVHQLNEEITDKEVRLIGSDGEQLGIMSAADFSSGCSSCLQAHGLW